jgi:hypothetical protein
MEEHVELLVSVADSERESIEDVAERLSNAGMQVKETLPELGTVVGSGPPGLVRELEQVRGVEKIARSGSFSLPPPDSPIQ